RSVNSRPCGSLTRPPKTRWSLLMTAPLASNSPRLQSALGADGIDCCLTARPGGLAETVDQRLDRAGAGVPRNVELGHLLPAGILGRVIGIAGAGGDPAAGLAH